MAVRPHVDGTLAGAADAPHLPGLEHAQEVRLQLERQLSELVEEQRPAVRLHEVAVARLQAALQETARFATG